MFNFSFMPRFVVVAAVAGLLGSAGICADAVRLWTPDPAVRIMADSTPGDEAAVALTCPRGGAVSAQVVVVAAAPLTTLTATLPDLTGADGAKIEQVQLRFATRMRDLGPGTYNFGKSDTFDVLSDTFVPGEKLQPVWVTPHVPADAKAGDYTGTLTIEADGTKLTLPIKLKVAEFTLKIPGERTYVHSLQSSQESLSLRYGVAPYSDEHFKLLERQLALMGELGNNVLYVPFIGKVHVGNDYGMVQLRKKGDGYEPDFTAFDRYFKLYQKYCGLPKSVTIILTARYMNTRGAITDDTETVWLTVRDDDGKLTATKMRAYPENEALWQALIDGLQKRMKDAGVADGTLRLGDLLDKEPSKIQLDFFARIAPGMKWSAFTHGYGGTGNPNASGWFLNGAPLSYGEYPDAYGGFDKITAIRRDWSSPYLTLGTMRGIHSDTGIPSNPFNFHCIPEMALGTNNQSIGLARIGLDYWTLQPNASGKGNAASIFGRYQPDSKIYRLYRQDTRNLTAPGSDGAVTLQRFEMLREGVQESEARCYLERTLTNKANQAKMGADLRKRCETLLIERITAIKPLVDVYAGYNNDSKWPTRAAALYMMADEVAAAMAK